MFSKTDDEFSQYLLIFKEFHLQPIVQPLMRRFMWCKNGVERYHVVERRDGLSFVGDLSVKEYLGDQIQIADGEDDLSIEDQTVETES